MTSRALTSRTGPAGRAICRRARNPLEAARAETPKRGDGGLASPRRIVWFVSSGGGRHLPALDGVRGIAVAAVVAYHLWPLTVRGGYLGVSVFFTLSGYLITGRILAEYERTGGLSLVRFYDRRFRRLLPAASAVVLAVVLTASLTGRSEVLSAGDVRSAVFWHYNWHELASDFQYGGVAPSSLGHYWSLSIEEQYYFLFPLAAMLALRFGGRRSLTWLVAAMALSGVLLALLLDSYFNSFSRMGEIAVGCLLAVSGAAITKAAAARALAAIGVAAMVPVFLFVSLPTRNELPNAALVVTMMATLACIGAATFDPPLLTLRPLVVLGKYSYSIYLVHWPIIVFVDGFVLRMALIAVCSVASYHLVESPIRLAKEVTPDATLHSARHNIGVDAGRSSDQLRSPAG